MSPGSAPTGAGILGFGVDLVHVPTFAAQLVQPGSQFESVFTHLERADSAGRAESLAARWAAKEAFIKAWSASLWGRPPVADERVHHLIEVVCDAWGRPRMELHGAVRRGCEHLRAHVSLSHDGDYALAQVIAHVA